MKKTILISILFSICSSVVGEEIKDSISSPDANKWHSNFGISLSYIGISKQKILIFSSNGKSITKYSSNYSFGRNIDQSLSLVIPEVSLILNTTHKHFIILNEFSFSNILTEYSFNILVQMSNPNRIENEHDVYDIHYTLVNYKLGIGFRFKKFVFIPGVQAGYVLSEHFDNYYNSLISDYRGPTGLKYIFGLNAKAGVQLSKKWTVEAVFFKQFFNKHSFGIAEKYSISTIQLSVTKIFYKKHINRLQ